MSSGYLNVQGLCPEMLCCKIYNRQHQQAVAVLPAYWKIVHYQWVSIQSKEDEHVKKRV